MARNYWVTSDSHYGHTNILKWGRGQFADTDEMDEYLIERWNEVVRPGDYVYHLGDVFCGPQTKERKSHVMKRLKGKKTLIVGNHDPIMEYCNGGWFRKVVMWKVFNEFNCLLTHVPVHESSLHERMVERGGLNVHGHIHQHESPPGPYKCVCVEQTNYSPVNLEDIRDGVL